MKSFGPLVSRLLAAPDLRRRLPMAERDMERDDELIADQNDDEITGVDDDEIEDDDEDLDDEEEAGEEE
jgi:hypothetical protein